MTARVEPVPAEPSAEWLGLIAAVGDELTVAVEETIEMMMGLSYRVIDESTLRSTVTSRFEMVVGGVGARRPPGLPEDEFSSDAFGELRARQGVTYADLLIGWRFGGDALYRLARRVAPDIPRRDSLLLEFLELTVRWVDYACLAMAAGHRRGELSRARELQHVQTNLVRRVLSGVAGPAELRNGLEPLHLDPDALYVAVCARPTARGHPPHRAIPRC
jgi:hypothetical protein